MTRSSELVPSAARLMHSLRDIGYDLDSAIADLVDNSVDAGAELVEIELHHAGDGSWLRVVDDGAGMTARAIEEAMRYGSRRPYSPGELGRFGLGLKTASLSQCRRLAVASRTTAKSRIAARRWDLNRVAASDSWELEVLRPSEAPNELVDPLRRTPGTVVLWDRLDRVEGFANPDGRKARAALERDADRIAAHLGIIFHRYLAGEVAGPPLTIRINGAQVTPWDPFVRTERRTVALKPQSIGTAPNTLVRPYVLPAQHEFSSPAAHEAAAGPKRWNRQQGFYIYRNDRMIQCGGWSRLRTMDEHSKLARIALDIPVSTEPDWRLNVAKMSVSIPEGIRAELRLIVGAVVSQAQGAYRKVNEMPGTPSGGAEIQDEWRLGDHWEAIASVLESELSDDPERLDRVLESLINSRAVHAGDPGLSHARKQAA